VCFTAYLNSPDQDIELNSITVKLIYDQNLFWNGNISTEDVNYSATEIVESAATPASGIAFLDFGGAPVFYEAAFNNFGTQSILTSAPQPFFTICLDAQPGVLVSGNEEFLTLLWDQISNDLNASGFDGSDQGIEVSIGGPNDEADEKVDHYGWDYGLGNGIFGGLDLNQPFVPPCQLTFCLFEELYIITSGPLWTNSDGWLDEDCVPCDWYGITCNSSDQVISIDLSNNNLIGQLPSTIRLYSAEVLDFSNNQLSGLIPIFQNASTTIRLDNNSFQGMIPEYLGNLPNLDVLTVTNNQLFGCYPSSLSNLCQISELSFDGNVFLPDFGDIDPFCNNSSGVCPTVLNDCDDTFAVIATSPIPNDTLRMKEYILVSGKVQSPNLTVQFNAGEFIEMFPGFEVQVPALFEANIEDCNN